MIVTIRPDEDAQGVIESIRKAQGIGTAAKAVTFALLGYERGRTEAANLRAALDTLTEHAARMSAALDEIDQAKAGARSARDELAGSMEQARAALAPPAEPRPEWRIPEPRHGGAPTRDMRPLRRPA